MHKYRTDCKTAGLDRRKRTFLCGNGQEAASAICDTCQEPHDRVKQRILQMVSERLRVVCLNTFSDGGRKRHPAELKEISELCRICECVVWSELTAVLK